MRMIRTKVKRIEHIKYDMSALKGRIFEKYGSQRAFAESIETTDEQVSRLLKGGLNFSRPIITTWVDILDIPNDEIYKYFFTPQVACELEEEREVEEVC